MGASTGTVRIQKNELSAAYSTEGHNILWCSFCSPSPSCSLLLLNALKAAYKSALEAAHKHLILLRLCIESQEPRARASARHVQILVQLQVLYCTVL